MILDKPIEVRSAFLLSDTVAGRIRSFRTERLGKIIAGETPINLDYSAKQKKLEIEPPLFIMLSFVGVYGYVLAVNQQYPMVTVPKIDRNDLIIPEVIINDYTHNIADTMKPVFDILWNAAGYREWMNYEKWSLHFQTKTAP